MTLTATATGTGSTTGSTLSATVSSGPYQQQLQLAADDPAPVATADAATAAWGLDLTVDRAVGLLANDEGFGLQVVSTSQPAHGTVTATPDGGWTYRADDHYEGPDSFTYQVADALRTTATASVSITVRSPHDAFVRAAYADFLRRPPSTAELDATVHDLDGGRSRSAVIDELAGSPEWIGPIVDHLYRDTLGRPGDPGGQAYWIAQIASGRRTVAQVAAEFYASGEYYRGIGGGSDATWITDLYRKLLDREPDPGGATYWIGQTVHRGRPSVAHRFFQSTESRRSRVRALYLELLGRAPDPAGVDYWAGRIERLGDIALAVQLAVSHEYLVRAQYRFS